MAREGHLIGVQHFLERDRSGDIVEHIDLGGYHDLDTSVIALPARSEQFKAVSIGPDSAIDAVHFVFRNKRFPVSVAAPVIMPFQAPFHLEPLYGQESGVTLSDTAGIANTMSEFFNLQVSLWKELPAHGFPSRGPKHHGEAEFTATTSEQLAWAIPTYGRRATRIALFEEDEASPQFRVAGAMMGDSRLGSAAQSQTWRQYPVWPTPGDATAFQTVSNQSHLSIHVEEWEALLVYHKVAASTATWYGTWTTHD